MMMRTNLKLIMPPTEAPVTLTEVKEYLRVDHSVDDLLIAGLIDAAVDMLDGPAGFLGRCLEPQTWELTLDRFPAAEIHIPLGPVAEVVSITYRARDGFEATVPADALVLDNTGQFGGWAVPSAPWPTTMHTTNAVRLRFIAGTGTPAMVKQSIIEMVAARYDLRGGEGRMLTPAIAADLAPYRRAVVA